MLQDLQPSILKYFKPYLELIKYLKPLERVCLNKIRWDDAMENVYWVIWKFTKGLAIIWRNASLCL